MAKNIVLSVLGAGMLVGLALPAYAQGDRSRGGDNRPSQEYSQSARQGDQNARRGNRASDTYHQRDRYDDRRDNNWRGNYRRGGKRLTFSTRFRATIVLTEDVVRSRRGPQQVCTVSVRGPQARLVPKKRLRRIARNNCSRRAKIRIYA